MRKALVVGLVDSAANIPVRTNIFRVFFEKLKVALSDSDKTSSRYLSTNRRACSRLKFRKQTTSTCVRLLTFKLKDA